MRSKRWFAALLAFLCAIPTFAPAARAGEITDFLSPFDTGLPGVAAAYEWAYADEETGLMFYCVGSFYGLVSAEGDLLTEPFFYTLHPRPEGSGSKTAPQRFMGDTGIMSPPGELVLGAMSDIVQTVEYRDFPNAIGYLFRFYITGLMRSDAKLLAVDGVAPTVENIASGAYPLVTELYAVTRAGEQNPNVAAFVQWIQTSQGMDLIETSGYVPVR